MPDARCIVARSMIPNTLQANIKDDLEDLDGDGKADADQVV